jgi:hypothetical protein
MKQSPVQLIQSQFVKIFVEYNDTDEVREDEEIDETDVGDDIGTVEINVEHMAHIQKRPSSSTSSEDSLRSYMLALGIRSGENGRNNMPYTFELMVTAIISVDPKMLVQGIDPDDSAAKYGFSIVYGQIREMLTTLTARMGNSQFILPTMSFMDATYPRPSTKTSEE